MNLEFIPIKTRLVRPPKDDISDIIDSLEVKDGDLIFITSKILSIHQGRTKKISSVSKDSLIKSESDRYLFYKNQKTNFHSRLTIKDNVLISAAGIDESNADGHYILWPKNPDDFCQKTRKKLLKKHHLKNLGIILTDSHTSPLRLGVTGLTIGFAGIYPLKDIRETPDLFGRNIHVSQINLIDPLASMAVLLMGETNESTPIPIIRGFHGIPFSETGSTSDLYVSPDLDLYAPLINVINTKKSPNQP